MHSRKWTCALLAVLMVLGTGMALAQGRGRGHDKDKGKEKGQREFRYSRQDRNRIMAWYRGYRGDLPPGLAKKDRLPPGLERQLRMRGTLPPGLQDQVRPLPPDVVSLLPPPPPDCEHVAIGGRIVLLNRRTSMVLDIFKLF